MPEIGIADKITLDSVNTKVGTNADAAGTTTLFARLAQIAGYTDQVEGYVDTLESSMVTVLADLVTLKGYTDTLETNVGSNADASSSTGSVHAKIKELRTLVDDLEARLTATRAGYLDRLDINVSQAKNTVTVQRGYTQQVTGSPGYADVTISGVDTTKSFVSYGGHALAVTNTGDMTRKDYSSLRLTSGTNLRVTSWSDLFYIAWEVVQIA